MLLTFESVVSSHHGLHRRRSRDKVFEIVNQLDRGSHLITSVDERARVAELNLLAGRRAKTSTAYASALSYLGAGRALLSEESWNNKYELIFAIEYLIAECEFLTGRNGGGRKSTCDAGAPSENRTRHGCCRTFAAAGLHGLGPERSRGGGIS